MQPRPIVMDSNQYKAPITLFLCGDVMTGRGIDQILPFPSNPMLHEPFMKNAISYVKLAEAVNGPIKRPVDFDYIWGAALQQLEQIKPDFRIINLETAVTTSEAWEEKGINYKMNPRNVSCLSAAKIDCCVLANNHVLDWGIAGLIDTLNVLKAAQIQIAGADINLRQAKTPAILSSDGDRRLLVFSFGVESSGIPNTWSATESKPGVNLLNRLDQDSINNISIQVSQVKRPNDIVIASIHWGGNWGYEISASERWFAHTLIDEAFVDIIHGHSSHHAKGIEVYRGKLILYGCGDFINDYEGISGHEHFRSDLALMYFPKFSNTRGLESLRIIPLQMKRFRLHPIQRLDALWLQNRLNHEGKELGTQFRCNSDYTLELSNFS